MERRSCRTTGGVAEGLTRVPRGLQTGAEGPVFFCKPGDVYGVFSQWYPCRFTVNSAFIMDLCGFRTGPGGIYDVDVVFNCVEQCMMYCRAVLFGDDELRTFALEAEVDDVRKEVGRRTVTFSEVEWTGVREQFVEMGNYAKFSQNLEFRDFLLATGDRELVNATRDDAICGIGMPAYTSKQQLRALKNRENWGENRLGKALERVRARLRDEDMSDVGRE